MKRYNYFICKSSQCSRGQWELGVRWGGCCSVAGCRRDTTRRSEHLDDSPWLPPMSSQEFSPRVFTEQSWCKRTGGGCGGLRLCNRSSSTMWLSDAPPPSEKRVTQDTRTKTCNSVLGLLLSPYLSPATIIKPLLPGGAGLSYRQPESGGSPISFVHFPTSFSAEPILPPG